MLITGETKEMKESNSRGNFFSTKMTYRVTWNRTEASAVKIWGTIYLPPGTDPPATLLLTYLFHGVESFLRS